MGVDAEEAPIRGQSVLVIGASRGIGAAIVSRFEEQHALVYAAGPTGGPPDSPGATSLLLDVTDRASVDVAIDRVVVETGSLDILVNNGGIMRIRDLFDTTEDDWDMMLGVNARGIFFAVQAAARVMRTARRGAIVNVASVAGKDGRTLSPAYAASKAAVINITRSTARELASQGIRVNAVCPGIIDTEFSRSVDREVGSAIGLVAGAFTTRRIGSVPLGRIGTPDDVAAAVTYLASPGASYITGQSINVDGGLVME